MRRNRRKPAARASRRAPVVACALALLLAAAAPGPLRADDTYSLGTVVTFGVAGTAANSQGTLTPDVTNTPVLSHITVSGDFTSLNGSFENELRVRLVGPPGTFNIQIGALGASGGVNVPLLSGAGFGDSPSANGMWTYQFFESFDDGGAAVQDSRLENCVIAFRGPTTSFPSIESFRTYLPATTAGTLGVRTNTAGTPGAPGWMEGRGDLAAPVVFSTPLASFSTAAIWVQDSFLNVGNVGALSMNTASAARSEWIVSPIYDLGDGAPTFNLFFDLGLTTAGGNAPGTLAADDVLSVLISDEGGGSWSTAGGKVIATYDATTPISPLGQTETISLAAFTGARRIGFHFFSNANNSLLDVHLDNVLILQNVPTLSIGDIAAFETHAGERVLKVPVTVANANGGIIDFLVDTVDGTARSADHDYVPIANGKGRVEGASGAVLLRILGDQFPEDDETLTVRITRLEPNSAILRDTATITIRDDDFVCGAPGSNPSSYPQVTLVGLAEDRWRFDNPGARPALAPIARPFAIFDSDNYSDNDTAEDVVLFAVHLPSTTFGAIEYLRVEWDEIFRAGFGGRQTVEISTDGGVVWTPILDNDATDSGNFATGAPAHRIIDITPLVFHEPEFRLRFRWRGNFGWWWIVDNVRVCEGAVPAGYSVLSISDALGYEGAGANSMAFMVRAVPPATAPITVDYAISSGTALLGTHFNAVASGSVVFQTGQTARSILLSPIDDAPGTRNPNRTLSARLTGVTSGPGIVEDAEGEGTINNDDHVPNVRLFGPNGFGAVGFAEFDPTNVSGTLFNNTVQAPTTSYFGGDFLSPNNYIALYATEFSANTMDAINTTNWSVVRTPLTGMLADHIPAGMAHDNRTNVMYLLSANRVDFLTWTLNTVDVSTGAVAHVANLIPPPTLAIGFACAWDPASTLYIIDQGTADQLKVINKVTGLVSSVGPLGINFGNIIGEADFAAFQGPFGTLYFTGFNVTSGQYGLYTANLTTGLATLVNNLQATGGLQEFSAFGSVDFFLGGEISPFGIEGE